MPPRRAAVLAAQAIAGPPTPAPKPKAPAKPANAKPKPSGRRQPIVPGRLPTLVLDNGGDTIKLAWVDHPQHPDGEVKAVINAITRAGPRTDRKTFVADELESQCRDYDKLQYNRPMEKGILTDWNTQKLIWDRLFESLAVEFENTRLLITETPFSLPNVQDGFDAMVFEEYEFAEYLRVPAALLTAFGSPPPLVPTPPSLQTPPSPTPSPPPFSEPLPAALPLPTAATKKARKSVFSRTSKSKRSSILPTPPPLTDEPPDDQLAECALVIDSGFSSTHVVPVFDGAVVWSAVRRLDVGGKLLTNYLKEVLSYRYLYMMDQTHVVSRLKETVAYVAEDYPLELRKYEDDPASIEIDYALPDFTDLSSDPTYKLGYLKDGRIPTPPPRPLPDGESGGDAVLVEEQILTLGRERFEIMEILFRPDLIGSMQAGLPEVVKQSIEALPEEVRGACWGNIVISGGNFRCPGMESRLAKELRAVAPVEFDVAIRRPADPVTYPASAAAFALTSPVLHGLLDDRFVSRSEYLSSGGSTVCRSMFGDAYADVEALYLDPSPADEETRRAGGGAARKRGRRTSSGEESELDDILADEKPEYIVRSTASRKRAMA